jgi:nucleoside 2-deoxyribosyltransferase
MTENKSDTLEQNAKEKVCFVITPISSENSVIRRAAEGVLDAVITPVLEKFGYKIVVAHRIATPGSINNQVIKHVLEAEMVVANLTGLNPNVMYELAIRHAKRKPVIVIVDRDVTPNLSFDLLEERAIFYTNDMSGTLDLAKNLNDAVVAAQAEKDEPDNPVYRTVSASVMKDLAPDNFQKTLVDMIFSLEAKIENLSSSRTNIGSVRSQRTLRPIEVSGKNPVEVSVDLITPKLSKAAESGLINMLNAFSITGRVEIDRSNQGKISFKTTVLPNAPDSLRKYFDDFLANQNVDDASISFKEIS